MYKLYKGTGQLANSKCHDSEDAIGHFYDFILPSCSTHSRNLLYQTGI